MVDLGAGGFALHRGVEEVGDVFAVVGDVQYVLLQGVLDAHWFEY